MARSYSAGSLVALPRLNAISAARLLTELISAAKDEKKLLAPIAAARDALTPAYDTLTIEIGKRISGEGKETPVVRAADAVEDNAFGAFFDWLSSFARLPGERHDEAAQAQAVLDSLFADGLEFLKIRPADEWQEAETRLKLLADAAKGHEKAIVKLGGKPFLDELAVAHKEYGQALGITVVKPVVDSPAIREALSDAIDELRAYVLTVSAHVKKKDAATAEMAARLLAPLIHWRDTPVKTGSSSDAANPAPEPPTTKTSPAPDAP